MEKGSKKNPAEILSQRPFHEVEVLYKYWREKKRPTITWMDGVLISLIDNSFISFIAISILLAIPEIMHKLPILNKMDALFASGLIRLAASLFVSVFVIERHSFFLLIIALYLFFTGIKRILKYRELSITPVGIEDGKTIDEELEKAFKAMRRDGIMNEGRIIFRKGIKIWKGYLGSQRVYFISPVGTQLESYPREAFRIQKIKESKDGSEHKVIMQTGTIKREGWVDNIVYERYRKWKNTWSSC